MSRAFSSLAGWEPSHGLAWCVEHVCFSSAAKETQTSAGNIPPLHLEKPVMCARMIRPNFQILSAQGNEASSIGPWGRWLEEQTAWHQARRKRDIYPSHSTSILFYFCPTGFLPTKRGSLAPGDPKRYTWTLKERVLELGPCRLLSKELEMLSSGSPTSLP